MKKISDNPGKFVSFNKVVQWDVLFGALTSMVVFLACIKAIKLLQYNQTISLLACTLKGSAKPLAAFFIVFFIFFMAFTTFAYLLFMSTLGDYRNFMTATESVLSLLLGAFSFGEIETAQPILGPVWFLLIMLFGVMYIMNVMLSIIMETYAEVKEDLTLQSQEFELVDFMVNKFKNVIGKGDKKGMGAFDGKKGGDDVKVISAKKRALMERKRIINEKRQKYNDMLNNEIEMKFSQLDDSLNDYFIENFELDNGVNDNRSMPQYDSSGPHSSNVKQRPPSRQSGGASSRHISSAPRHSGAGSHRRREETPHSSGGPEISPRGPEISPRENDYMLNDPISGVVNPGFEYAQFADDDYDMMREDLSNELSKWQ